MEAFPPLARYVLVSGGHTTGKSITPEPEEDMMKKTIRTKPEQSAFRNVPELPMRRLR